MIETPEWLKDIMRPQPPQPPKPTGESSIEDCIMIMDRIIQGKKELTHDN